MSWDIRIGDQVIIKDQKPGWKFCTPYEPRIGTVTRVPGTMAEKGRERVICNISWFRKATFVEPSDELESNEYSPRWSTTEGPESGCEGDVLSVTGPATQRQPVTSAPVAQEGEARSQSQRPTELGYRRRSRKPPCNYLSYAGAWPKGRKEQPENSAQYYLSSR
ncbi:hypothetical protein NDU88_006630 [Pleurodeles waltl]|uniref:Uncharacterized protein n=1 Tax=Pleurodeles waltl TaxID=8319 RepID=A0AAV7WGW9_PLEWA|nr:hypothetical protein NDU88_006630 [Pleurodeles waltl]